MGISPVQLGIILVIVALLFGTKRLRGIGSDLGAAIKGFKHALDEQPQRGSEHQGLDKNVSLHASHTNDATQASRGKKKTHVV